MEGYRAHSDPSNLTRVGFIDVSAFRRCGGLKQPTLPSVRNPVTSRLSPARKQEARFTVLNRKIYVRIDLPQFIVHRGRESILPHEHHIGNYHVRPVALI